MAGIESKYERVEKTKVDDLGNPQETKVAEDRGREDPGMNFQDKRNGDLVPGAPAGTVPNFRESELRRDSNSLGGRSASQVSNTSSGFVDASLNQQGPRTGGAIETSSRTYRESQTLDKDRRNRSPDSSIRSSDSSIISGKDRLPAAKVPFNKESNLSSIKSSSSQSSTTTNSSMDTARRMEQVASNDIRQLDRPLNSDLRDATGVTTQRTTIVTEQVNNGNLQRTVPIQPHRQREEREVIQHETRARAPETHIVTIPTTRFDSAKMESLRTGVTYTQDKELTIPAPVVAPQIQSHQTVSLGGGTHAEITATTAMNMASEAQIKDMGPEEYARYRAKVESLARQHEQETSQKAAEYRNQVEMDAELIRQTLERQHIRDIEFRKDLVESAVDRQQLEIQLEAEYAMRALENEREQARAALEQAKASTKIDVNIDSAVGTTHSEGRVTTRSEARSEAERAPVAARRI